MIKHIKHYVNLYTYKTGSMFLSRRIKPVIPVQIYWHQTVFCTYFIWHSGISETSFCETNKMYQSVKINHTWHICLFHYIFAHLYFSSWPSISIPLLVSFLLRIFCLLTMYIVIHWCLLNILGIWVGSRKKFLTGFGKNKFLPFVRSTCKSNFSNCITW